MCKERNSRNVYIYHQNRYVKVDRCIVHLINSLNIIGVKTLACCCGHGKYPMSIVVLDDKGRPFNICDAWLLEQKKKFYKKDKEGLYHIISLPPFPKVEGIREEFL